MKLGEVSDPTRGGRISEMRRGTDWQVCLKCPRARSSFVVQDVQLIHTANVDEPAYIRHADSLESDPSTRRIERFALLLARRAELWRSLDMKSYAGVHATLYRCADYLAYSGE